MLDLSCLFWTLLKNRFSLNVQQNITLEHTVHRNGVYSYLYLSYHKKMRIMYFGFGFWVILEFKKSLSVKEFSTVNNCICLLQQIAVSN